MKIALLLETTSYADAQDAAERTAKARELHSDDLRNCAIGLVRLGISFASNFKSKAFSFSFLSRVIGEPALVVANSPFMKKHGEILTVKGTSKWSLRLGFSAKTTTNAGALGRTQPL